MAAMRYIALIVAVSLMAAMPLQAEIGSGYDTSLPIEINANTVEYQQEGNIAIFRGAVDAVQGELNLRADQLTVHFKSNAEGKNSISIIEADGNVFLSSPTEMAEGEKGVYNVEADTVVLVGSVKLYRGDSTISGDRLEMDLATGQSTVLSSGVETDDDGRVKLLFVPSNDNSE